MEVKVVGKSCGTYGTYTFYKGIQIKYNVPIEPDQLLSGPSKQNHLYQLNTLVKSKINRRCDRTSMRIITETNDPSEIAYNEPYSKRKSLVLGLGDCVPVRPWSDSPITCLAELRMVWRDKNEQQLLTALRLYFLPENTPMGRNCHGEDEVLAISDKVVIRANDLLNWMDFNIEWSWGIVIPFSTENDGNRFGGFSLRTSQIDLEDVNNEKDRTNTSTVSVISYARYCRYRATIKRLENMEDVWLRNTLIQVFTGLIPYASNTRIMFCKDTFDYPELETHELLCNHLAPKLKNRTRGRRKKLVTNSPTHGPRIYSPLTDSDASEISACSVEKVFSKFSPMIVKPEFKQGKHQLAKRPQLRYNPRPARSKVKSRFNRANRRKTREQIENSESNHKTDDDSQDRRKANETAFIQHLLEFHANQNTNIPKVFWMSIKHLHLLAIYKRVKKLGGYEVITARKGWKYLFGEKSDSTNTISRKKYQRALLPYETYEKQNEVQKESEIDPPPTDELTINEGGAVKIEPTEKLEPIKQEKEELDLSQAEMIEIQRQIKEKKSQSQTHTTEQSVQLNMSPMNLPVTVIVGGSTVDNPNLSTSPQIKIQQPHTTITVHQTTIHPQNSGSNQQISNQIQITNQIQIQQITVQQNSDSGSYTCNIKQDENGQEVQIKTGGNNDVGTYPKRQSSVEEFSGRDGHGFIAQPKIQNNDKTSSLRYVRLKADRARDRTRTELKIPTFERTLTNPTPDKENIPSYLLVSKSTTITPILNSSSNSSNNSNSNIQKIDTKRNSISEIIDLVDSDNDSQCNYNPIYVSNIKRRKLDMLREGGLEVTAITNTAITAPNTNVSVTSTNQESDIESISPAHVQISENLSEVIKPKVKELKYMTQCMYTRTDTIYSDPRDTIQQCNTTHVNHFSDPLDLRKTNRKKKPKTPEILRIPSTKHPVTNNYTPPINYNYESSPNTVINLSDKNVNLEGSSLTLTKLLSSDSSTPTQRLTHVQNIHNSQNHNIKRNIDVTVDKPNQPNSTSKTKPYKNTTFPFPIPSEIEISPVQETGSNNSTTSSDDFKMNPFLLTPLLAQLAEANQTASTNQPYQVQTNPMHPFAIDPQLYLSALYSNPGFLFSPHGFPSQELLAFYKSLTQLPPFTKS